MKKFIYIIFGILLCSCTKGTSSCTKETIYHTYYGDIDIDTAKVELRTEKSEFYIVHKNKDTLVFYSPLEDMYLMQFPTNDEHGNVVAKFNPEDGSLTGNW